MNERSMIKLLARVGATEWLLTHVIYGMARNVAAENGTDAMTELKRYQARVRAELDGATMVGLDPARSDAYAQELADAADRLLDGMIERLDQQARAEPSAG